MPKKLKASDIFEGPNSSLGRTYAESQLKSVVDLIGSKKGGWMVKVKCDEGYKYRMIITHEEAVMLRDLLNERIK